MLIVKSLLPTIVIVLTSFNCLRLCLHLCHCLILLNIIIVCLISINTCRHLCRVHLHHTWFKHPHQTNAILAQRLSPLLVNTRKRELRLHLRALRRRPTSSQSVLLVKLVTSLQITGLLGRQLGNHHANMEFLKKQPAASTAVASQKRPRTTEKDKVMDDTKHELMILGKAVLQACQGARLALGVLLTSIFIPMTCSVVVKMKEAGLVFHCAIKEHKDPQENGVK